MQDFIAIDFETANPKRVSACALGYAIVSNGSITEAKGYLIKPIGGHAPFQSKIHGIKEEHTADKPGFDELFPEIQDLFHQPLVAHSLFDKQVLNALADHFNLPLDFEYHDSSSLAKNALPSLKNHKLKTLAKHFQLQEFNHHDATEDAVACANIYLHLQDLALDPQETGCGEETEFSNLISSILEDNLVEYKEAYQLLYWLEDHPGTAKKNMDLFLATQKFLEDDYLDEKEAEILRIMLQRIQMHN